MNEQKHQGDSGRTPGIVGCLLLVGLLATTVIAMVAGSLVATNGKHPIENLMLGIRDGFTEETTEETDDELWDDSDDMWEEDDTSDTSEEDTSDLPTDTTESSDTVEPGSDTDDTSSDTEDTSESETDTDTDSETVTTTPPDTTTQKPVTTDPPVTDPPATESPITDEERVNDPDYFHDALFIGDSRTVGLSSYGKIPGATYFARTSMNVKNCLADKPSSTEKSGMNLTEFLTANKFGKIYILLGINEIGYSYSWIIKYYNKILDTVRELQPQAIIVIQANMHVTKAKSDANPKTFNNGRINELNRRLSELADNKTIFYIDVNEVFDDSNGSLNSSYTGDGVHLKGKYYAKWRDWLVENGKR